MLRPKTIPAQFKHTDNLRVGSQIDERTIRRFHLFLRYAHALQLLTRMFVVSSLSHTVCFAPTARPNKKAPHHAGCCKNSSRHRESHRFFAKAQLKVRRLGGAFLPAPHELLLFWSFRVPSRQGSAARQTPTCKLE